MIIELTNCFNRVNGTRETKLVNLVARWVGWVTGQNGLGLQNVSGWVFLEHFRTAPNQLLLTTYTCILQDLNPRPPG